MDEANKFPQLLEVAQRLPDFPWAKSLDADSPEDWPTDEEYEAAERQQAPTYLAQHAGTLSEARKLLQHPCRNWAPATQDAFRDSCDRMQATRSLARSLMLSATLAENSGDFAAAIDCCQDCLRLAVAHRQGGLIVDYLVSVAIEQCAIEPIRRMRRNLPSTTLRSLIQLLEAHEAAREPYDAIADRDARWEAENGSEEPEDENWINSEDMADLSEEQRQQIIAHLEAVKQRHALMTPEEIEQERRDCYETSDLRSLSRQRLLRIELAILAFQAEQGSLPERLDQLAPSYLAVVPLDPHGCRAYRYRRNSDDYVLYGLNQQQVDYGGRKGGILSVHNGAADLFLDYLEFSDDLDPAEPAGFGSRILAAIRSAWRSIFRS